MDNRWVFKHPQLQRSACLWGCALAFGQALSVPGLKSILGCHSRFHNQARLIENMLWRPGTAAIV